MSSREAGGVLVRVDQRSSDRNYSQIPEWVSVEEYCRGHNLDDLQIRQLKLLFGTLAERCELWANVRWPPRYR